MTTSQHRLARERVRAIASPSSSHAGLPEQSGSGTGHGLEADGGRAAPLPERPAVDQPRWLPADDEDAPARPALTRRRIVLTALQVVEDEGLAAVTMRRVASALKVTPMSLYNHVADKAELVDLMVDFVIGDVVAKSADDTGDWEARLRALALRDHAMWRNHPGFVRVYTEGVTLGPNGLALTEKALGLLREGGFSNEDAGAAFLVLYRWIVASLLVAPTRAVTRSQDVYPGAASARPDRMKVLFSALPRDEIPNIVATSGYLTGTSIDFGLDIIMTGFKAHVAAVAAAKAAAARAEAEPAPPTDD